MIHPRPFRWLPIVWPCLLLLVVALGCQAPKSKSPLPTPELPATKGVLRVGVTPNMPPLIYRQDGQIVGLEAELAKGLAQHLERRLELVEVGWDDQIPYLEEGRTDIIMSGMSVTDMRRIRIAFSNPYAKTGQMALIRRRDIQRFKTGYYSLVEIPRYGAVRDTTGAMFIRTSFPDFRKLFFDHLDDGVKALVSNKIDVFIHDAPAVMMAAAKFEKHLAHVPKIFTNEYLAWGIRKDNSELIKQANGYITALKKDGRLKEIVYRWIPFTDQ